LPITIDIATTGAATRTAVARTSAAAESLRDPFRRFVSRSCSGHSTPPSTAPRKSAPAMGQKTKVTRTIAPRSNTMRLRRAGVVEGAIGARLLL